MESFISLISVLLTMIGGFVWLGIMLGNLKGRLDSLEGRKHFEKVEQDFLHKIEVIQKDARVEFTQLVEIARQQLETMRQEAHKLKQQVSEPLDPATILAETLPEISFETAFIDRNENIRRETRTARQLTENLGKGVVLEMIYIPGGTFTMGGHGDNEIPEHPVTVKSFFAGKYPITQEQWEAVVGKVAAVDSYLYRGQTRPKHPLISYEHSFFCAKLSQNTGKQYRLLSEAQWEYACRAGSVTRYSFGEFLSPELANYADSGINDTTEVGKYPANSFGLYDMHGNVWEMCEDEWHSYYVGAPRDGSAWMNAEFTGYNGAAVMRGGSWCSISENDCRSSYRTPCSPYNVKVRGKEISILNLTGFRVCLIV